MCCLRIAPHVVLDVRQLEVSRPPDHSGHDGEMGEPLRELRLPKESHCDVGQRADGDEVDLPRVLYDLPHDEVYCVLAVRLDRFILRF